MCRNSDFCWKNSDKCECLSIITMDDFWEYSKIIKTKFLSKKSKVLEKKIQLVKNIHRMNKNKAAQSSFVNDWNYRNYLIMN